VPGIVSLSSGIDFITETGMDKIKKKKEEHFSKITEGLQEVYDSLIIYGGCDITERIPLFCFNIRYMDPGDVGYILENSFHIIVRSGLHCAPLIHKALGSYPRGSVRVSPSYFTSDKDIEHFIDAVKQICRGSL
jgi:selenocysteine lyase/cysteine desulfurase